MAGEGPRISLGISGINLTLERLAGSTSQELSLEVPVRVDDEGIERMTRDAEALAQVLRNYPNEMSVLLEAVYSGNFDDARKVADALGVTESGFRSHHGGLFWIVVVVAALAILGGLEREAHNIPSPKGQALIDCMDECSKKGLKPPSQPGGTEEFWECVRECWAHPPIPHPTLRAPR